MASLIWSRDLLVRRARHAALCLMVATVAGAQRAPKPAAGALPAAALALPGPDSASRIAEPRVAQVATYRHDAPQAIGVYVTDPDASWMSLARGLEAAGIPFDVTTDWKRATSHAVVLVYPTISGRVVPAEGLQALAAHPRNGGTVIASELLGGGLESLFGVDSIRPSGTRRTVAFTDSAAGAWGLASERERTAPVGSRVTGRSGLAIIGTNGYAAPTATVLARFDDGTAAVTHRAVGTGHAWIVGVDLGALLHLGYDNREDGVARAYVNTFEPTLDVLLGVIGAAWRQGEPAAVARGTVPWGRAIAVSLTHDVDFSQDWPHALDFARMAARHGARSTFFVQTKYVRDFNDKVFYDREAIAAIRALDSLGMEIASHSVAHARTFRTFPVGTGTERFPDYRPFVKDLKTVTGGSVLGELRVSRWLLEQAMGNGHRVMSFRPGVLANPFALPQALEATGYAQSSTMTANNALTHRPFRLSYDRAGAAESEIWEFPVAIEDEEKPPMLQRVDRAIALARDVMRYHGTLTVLIHPTESTGKLQFADSLLSALGDSAWVAPLGAMGRWWAARTAVEVAATRTGATATVTLVPRAAVEGFALEVPAGWQLLPSEGVTQRGRMIVVAALAGEQRLSFRVSGAP
ncbi:MAG: beta-galactosidase trimerization domain-containing protein [Gemmatimonadetes bacterium]|nr:beta-galactosidase trimerization domain-containing protein [Gemmatimonadota bacterium]